MRLLVMSDIHCRFSQFRPEDMPPPEEIDAVIVAGDITDMGKPKGYRPGVSESWERAEGWMGQIALRYGPSRLFWVPGNHDINVTPEDLPGTCLLGIQDFLRAYRFTGSALCTAFDSPKLAEAWAHTTAIIGEDLQHWLSVPAADIVVSHCPPLGVLDGAGRIMQERKTPDGSIRVSFSEERHIGSPGLLEYIKRHRPRLVVCGHCHEAWGRQMVGEALVVNTAERWQVIEL